MNGTIATLSRVCLPGPLLRRAARVALLPPAAVADEWQAWQSDVTGPSESLRDPGHRLRRLMPLIDANLRAAGVRLDNPLKSFLRMAAAHEKMRWEVVESIFGAAMATLVQQRIEFLVQRGMALAATVYRQPFLRHCHDLDLLVQPGLADAAANCLANSGFLHGLPPPGSDAESRWVVHSSGFPIGIHVRPFRLAPWNREIPRVKDCPAHAFAGQVFRTLDPAQMLAAVCIHAATVGSVHSPSWITDAWYLLAATPHMDWDRILASGPALPLWLTLSWLQRELGAPVPMEVLDCLHNQVTGCDEATRKQAGAAAMLCSLGRSGELLRSTQGIGERLHWIRQLAMPESSILRWVEHSDAPSALLYLRRLRRFARAGGV